MLPLRFKLLTKAIKFVKHLRVDYFNNKKQPKEDKASHFLKLSAVLIMLFPALLYGECDMRHYKSYMRDPDKMKELVNSCHLRFKYLTGAGLMGADFTNVDLTGANLQNLDLSQAVFTGAKFRYNIWQTMKSLF